MPIGFFRGSALQRSNMDEGRGLPKCGVCKFAPECSSPRLEVGGKGKLPILVVGEAPSEDVDRQGLHFVGIDGQRLRDSFNEIGHKLRDCHLTYAMICRPLDGSTFTDVNINACRPTILKTIDEIKPKVIIMLGPAPVRSLIPAERGGSVGAHERWLGHAIPSAQHGAWLCPTYSPKQVMHYGEDPVILKLWHSHIRHAFSLVNRKPNALTMKDLWNKVEIITSPRLARLRLKKLAKQEGVLAFDYEANCLKPDRDKAKLLAASFCLDGEDTFALLIKNDETLRALSPVLRSRRLHKIASNLKNEERWTISKLKHKVHSWHWDTMLAAHCLDNRQGISSIKFQAFLYFGVADYNRFVEPFFETDERTGFNSIEKMDYKDLLNYNALDSLLEYMVAIEQQKQFGPKLTKVLKRLMRVA